MEPVPALEGPSLGPLFSGHGYATAIIGKTHFVARRIENQHVAGQPLEGERPPDDFRMVCPEPYYSEVEMKDVDLGSQSEDFPNKPPFYQVYKDSGRWGDGAGTDSYQFLEPNPYGFA